MTDKDSRPYLVLTVVLDSSARAAAITRSHGDAVERADRAAQGKAIAGLDIIELPIASAAFHALRSHLGMPGDTVGLYDIFPLSAALDPNVRKTAGQFLAAEVLWTLEEQGLMSGVPLSIRLDIPKGWSKEPKEVHAKLVEAGALELTMEGIETFKAVKDAWDASARA